MSVANNRMISRGSILEQAMKGPSALERSKGYGNKAMSYTNKLQPNIPEPEKTVAGGAMSGLGGAGAGAATGAAIGAAGGPIGAGAGAIIGGVIGLANYYWG